MKRRVHTFGGDQLGSELIRLLCAWRLSESLDAEYICHWPEQTVLRSGFRFAELFDGETSFTLSQDYPKLASVPRLDVALNGIEIDAAKLPREFVYATSGLRLLPGEDMATARTQVRSLFSRLRVAEPITDAIEEIDAAIPLRNMMAVHIRRGSDIISGLLAGGLSVKVEDCFIRGYGRMFVDLESYRRAVKALGSPDCFVFCPDEADRIQIKEQIGAHTVDEFPSIQRLTPLQRDLCEILLMARTSRLLGPKSNFSGLARLLGDLRLEWIARWLSADDMVAMIMSDFPGRPDLHARIMRAASDSYARAAPAASAHFAAIAANVEARGAHTLQAV